MSAHADECRYWEALEDDEVQRGPCTCGKNQRDAAERVKKRRVEIAAPDLLAALEDLVSGEGDHAGNVAAARAAIAAARGVT
jgi:hypothetical protein